MLSDKEILEAWNKGLIHAAKRQPISDMGHLCQFPECTSPAVCGALIGGELGTLCDVHAPSESHGCLTGDCPHGKQAECDKELRTFESEKESTK